MNYTKIVIASGCYKPDAMIYVNFTFRVLAQLVQLVQLV